MQQKEKQVYSIAFDANRNVSFCVYKCVFDTFLALTQIEDMSQQAQMAAAEKFKETPLPSTDTPAHATVSLTCLHCNNLGRNLNSSFALNFMKTDKQFK